jgi:hypothetical protein
MMERLVARGQELAREAQQRGIREMAQWVTELLPRAEIELSATGFSIRELRLLDRWMDDMELRFLGSIAR